MDREYNKNGLKSARAFLEELKEKGVTEIKRIREQQGLWIIEYEVRQ